MGETCLLKIGKDVLDTRKIHLASSNVIPTTDDFISANLNKCNSLGISRLETDRSSCGDVKAVSICFDAVKLELGIRLDEVIVGTNLLVLAIIYQSP